MPGLFDLFHRFRADERGVFAITFGLMAIVLIALGGAVVDYMSLEQTRSRAQAALDAATLALQPRIFDDEVDAEKIKSDALTLLQDRVADDRVTVTLGDPEIDVGKGSLLLRARIVVPTIFVSLVGVQEMPAQLLSEATRKMLDLEVAMVLDNSGSMKGSRMSNLITAAKCATNILFYGEVGQTTACTPVDLTAKNQHVKIGIVPFTIMVNIGTQFKDENWLDWSGESTVSRLNFDDDEDEDTLFLGPVDRKYLFAQTSTSWRGCVEARISPYDTNDEAPEGIDRVEKLFVPLFTPDGLDNTSNSYIDDERGGTCVLRTCSVTTNKGVKSYTIRNGSTVSAPSPVSCIPPDPSKISGDANNGTYNLLSRHELQERMCKYNGSTTNNSTTNYGCPTVSLLPLTNNPTTVLNKIGNMVAAGSTNIQQGTIWGLHALTNTAPLTEALPRNDAAVKKVLIVMTDGENDPPFIDDETFNWGNYYSWGFPNDGRLVEEPKDLNGNGRLYDDTPAMTTETPIRAAMDAKTIAACASAKAMNIEVFTIGLASNDSVKQMLINCSSGSGYSFFPTTPTELNNTFRLIAGQLAQLRIAQ
jgi:Flp pilus assembly pilin Flp